MSCGCSKTHSPENGRKHFALEDLQTTLSVFLDIFYRSNLAVWDETGVFQQPLLVTIIENLRAPYLANRVVIQDYDPRWPQMFEMLRSRIAVVLNGGAHSIEHVGSTAVPGLAAKPVIDIDVLLRSASDLPLVIRRLADLGYDYRGDLGVI